MNLCPLFLNKQVTIRFWKVLNRYKKALKLARKRQELFECDSLNRFINVQEGQTDSERILCYIVDRINTEQEHLKRPLSQEERFQIMDQIICEITVENKVNLLIYDGNAVQRKS